MHHYLLSISKRFSIGLAILSCAAVFQVSMICQNSIKGGFHRPDEPLQTIHSSLNDFVAHNSPNDTSRSNLKEDKVCACNLSGNGNHQELMSNETTYLRLRSWGLFEQKDGARAFVHSQPAHGTVWITSSNVIYTPFKDFSGRDTLVYLVHDEDDSKCLDTLLMDVNDALPMHLYMFDAFSNHLTNSVELVWMTSTEVNNESFKVFRSDDAYSWHSLEELEAIGTSNKRMEYRITDINPLSGVSYYKIRQIDYDGRFRESEIKALEFERKRDIIVYPNPANEFFYILDNEMILDSSYPASEVRMFDPSGKMIDLDLSLSQGLIKVQLSSSLPSGHYLLTIEGNVFVVYIN